MTGPVDRRRFLRTTAEGGLAAGLAMGVASADDGDAASDDRDADGEATLTAGVATRDITPENGDQLFGYVRPDLRVDGVAVRLFAQALVIGDGERKLAIVTADLGQPGELREAVLEHARPLGFDRDTVLFTTTHTHAGPDDMGDWMAAQIGDAIAEADATREPARAGWGTAEVPAGNYNRSIEAHLANFGKDIPPGEGSPEDHPVDPERARDTTLRLLRLESLAGDPIAAWTLYANHPTTFTVDNTRYSADFPGLAARLFADRFDGDSPVAMYSNGNLGDLITPYDEYGMYAVAERTATRVERAMWEAWEAAGRGLSRRLELDARTTIAEYEGQELNNGERVARAGVMGKPLLNGGENGPTPVHGLPLEGRRRPEVLADPVHGRKIPLIPAPWSPDVEIQALRLGDRLLVTVPGEPTTEMGRRMRTTAAAAGPDDVADVAVVGIANGYNGYFTTPEEYDRQHYEGGHTVFGKYTSVLVEEVHADLAASLAHGDREPPSPSGSRPDRPDAPVGNGSDGGRITDGPGPVVERLRTLSIEWEGGSLGKDRPVGEPFVRLERRGDDGWESVATDLDLGLVWTESAGTYTARYDVPPDLPAGTYRVRVTAARYELESDAFDIVPSRDLVVRGLEVDQRGREGPRLLAFDAQHPAPDPDENMRLRPRRPTGGTLTFRLEGDEYTAAWDEAEERWTARVPREVGETVVVPAGGLEDAYGNHSGERVELTVGEVAPLEWPDDMETGGGNPPGLLGIGEFPT